MYVKSHFSHLWLCRQWLILCAPCLEYTDFWCDLLLWCNGNQIREYCVTSVYHQNARTCTHLRLQTLDYVWKIWKKSNNSRTENLNIIFSIMILKMTNGLRTYNLVVGTRNGAIYVYYRCSKPKRERNVFHSTLQKPSQRWARNNHSNICILSLRTHIKCSEVHIRYYFID